MPHQLVQIGLDRFNHPHSQDVHLVPNDAANIFLSNLDKSPHAFVLACLMDRQIYAEKAWMIPFTVCQELNIFDIDELSSVAQYEFQRIFERRRLHRFNIKMSKIFYNGIKDIMEKYQGRASLIWENRPSSASVVYRFMQFKGSGIKISTMAANILARQFRIPFSDYYSIDISPDIHIKRVMKRVGLIPNNSNNEMIAYKARELNPEFPGIIDYSCWEIGRTWCRPTKPNCQDCLINESCLKII